MPEARYEIVRQLACGGMAEVLLARQNADDGSIKLVVLKRVLTHLAQNDGFLKMFAHEARIASQLRHPNIVQVLEVGEHEGLPVLVMERLEGADLLRLLQQCVTRRQSLGTAVSMAILAGAARGLGYAHRARSSDGRALRLIHRDISPHNVFITRDGGVKLLDFGIAKSAAHVGLTSTGQVKGKISYMSPEQIRSLPIDARSDLWSLGVVLWETLAGEKLFTRDNDAATLHAILHDPIPLLNRREAPGLDDLIARILQRDPAARIGTAEEIAAALEGMLEAMRSGPPTKLVAQRVASLVPAISPEFDLARPAAPSQEVVTLAVGPGGTPPAKRAPTLAAQPVAPALNRYSKQQQPPARSYDDDVAVDEEPTQMDMPTVTATSAPPEDEATRAVPLPGYDEEPVARAPSRPSQLPLSAPPMSMSMARPATTPPPPPRNAQPSRPPPNPGPARPPVNPRSRTSTVMGTGAVPPHMAHPSMLADEVDPPTAQLARPATLAPPRAAAPMPFAMASSPMHSSPMHSSPQPPPNDLFGPVPYQGPDSVPPFDPQGVHSLRPGAPSPFSNNPLAGFAARSPDTFVAAEIARPAPPPPARPLRWLAAAGSLMLAAALGVVVTQRLRSTPTPRAPMAVSEPMPVIHVPESTPPVAAPVAVAAPAPAPVAVAAPAPAPVAVVVPAPAPAPAPVAAVAPVAVAAPAPAPAPVAVAAPVVVAVPAPAPAPAPVAVPAPAPAPAPVAVAAPAPAPVAVAAPVRPAAVVRPRVVATAPAPATTTRVAAAARPTPAARPSPLVDPFDTPAAPARPRTAPTPVARTAAPTPVARTAAPRAADPFTNVYSDPTQRRPVARPRVQAPPSAHTGAIITEF
nr:protein kinase [Deltaproteobacteria bacterium]